MMIEAQQNRCSGNHGQRLRERGHHECVAAPASSEEFSSAHRAVEHVDAAYPRMGNTSWFLAAVEVLS